MPSKPLDRVTIFNVTIVVEAILLLTATFWSQLGEIYLLPIFRCHRIFLFYGLLGGLFTASSGFALLWLARSYGESSKWLGTLKSIVLDEVAPLFAQFTVPDIIMVAAASGFCEEVFFRGVIQEQSGIVAASAFFGIFHCPSFRHFPYGVWAFCAGLFLGFLKDWTGSVWTPIIAHAVSNFVVLLYLRYGLKQAVKNVS
jgi:membrane protease YdiL (CAAX protease family)